MKRQQPQQQYCLDLITIQTKPLPAPTNAKSNIQKPSCRIPATVPRYAEPLLIFRDWRSPLGSANIFQVTDPKAPTIDEGTGYVAPSSLAAESNEANEKFSENPNSDPSDGGNPRDADTSRAIRLDPAQDAESREAQEDWAEEKKLSTYPSGLGGQSKGTAVEDTTGSSATGGSSSHAGTAPSYVNSQFIDTKGPHGKNITEGGFESDDKKNASMNSEIGGENDPGRLAEQKFENANADTAGNAGMQKQMGTTGDSQYDTLDNKTSA